LVLLNGLFRRQTATGFYDTPQAIPTSVLVVGAKTHEFKIKVH